MSVVKYDECRDDVKKYSGINQWFDAVVTRHDFTVFIFFRGGWCPGCNAYLKACNDLIEKIEENGGNMYCITAQRKHKVREFMEKNGLKLTCIGDSANKIGRRFKIPITQKSDGSFRKLLEFVKTLGLAKEAIVEDEIDYKYGVVQPGLLIINRAGEEVYSWRTKVGDKNKWGTFDRIDPAYIINLAIEGRLSGRVMKPIIPATYAEMRESPEARELFFAHLRSIYCDEMLRFVEATDELNNSRQAIVSEFISDDGGSQVNLPSSVQAKYKRDRMVFKSAYSDVLRSLELEYARFAMMNNSASSSRASSAAPTPLAGMTPRVSFSVHAA